MEQPSQVVKRSVSVEYKKSDTTNNNPEQQSRAVKKTVSVEQGQNAIEQKYVSIHRIKSNVTEQNQVSNATNNILVEQNQTPVMINNTVNAPRTESNATEVIIERTKYDPTINIEMSISTDLRPERDGYFIGNGNVGKESKGLAVIIPFFNEASHELQQTLHSLNETWRYLRKINTKWCYHPLYVCLIQDGWNKADPSMREYLKTIFPHKIDNNGVSEYWWDYCAKDLDPKSESDKTFVFQKTNHGKVIINPQPKFKDNPIFMRITLIIKTKNRRKHNSHEWFFGKHGFAESVNPLYLFLTDAFTMYNETCLYHLVSELDHNKHYVAATGRQRVMTRDQQGSTGSIFTFGETFLRNVQACDFEFSNTIYNGAFDLSGILPVVPGPCGLYRTSALFNNNVREYYFGTVNEDPSATGLVLENLKIAEDRVLTYASVVLADESSRIKFNPLAIFYFEAETDLMKFILQRRRWINGSVAGYIYLLFTHFAQFQKWKTNLIRKAYVWTLLMCQFITYMMVGLAPGISIKMLYYGIKYFLDYYEVKISFDIVIMGVAFWAIYIAHVLMHNRARFVKYIMYPLVLISILTTSVSIASLFHYAFVYTGMPFVDVIVSGGPILYMGLYVFFGPFIVSLLLSGKGHSMLYMIKSFLPYFLFLPMLITWFGSYSYSRLWDVSWGNRPSNELDTISSQLKKAIVTKFKDINKIIILALAVINIGVFFIPLRGQLILMSVFFAIASYQLTMSIVYCIVEIVYKIGFVFKKCRERYNPTVPKDTFSDVGLPQVIV